MSKEIVPKLRFPEFKDVKEWKETAIGKLTKVTTGGTPDSTNSKYWNGNIPWMNSGELNQKRVYSVSNRITQLGLKESSTKLIPPQCVLIGLAGQGRTRGTAATNYFELCINQSIAAIYPNDSVFSSEFLYQFVNSSYEQLRALSTGEGGRGGLNLETIKSYKLYLPSLEEQQKIAACLSSLDELIAAQGQKLEALKAHKKGLMQQLFPAEDETVPKLRFAEFKDSGEWEEKMIGEVAKVTTGNRDTQDKVDNGTYPFFVRSQTVERINSYAYDGEAILTSGDGVGVGKNFHYINGKFNFHQRVYSIYGFNENAYGKFIYLYFSEHFNQRVMKMSAKNSVDSVRMAMITEMPIVLPSLNEQQEIATCIFFLENLITAQAEKTESLIMHKKGLMQQLFPNTLDVNE